MSLYSKVAVHGTATSFLILSTLKTLSLQVAIGKAEAGKSAPE
jgi:hypothetical protein